MNQKRSLELFLQEMIGASEDDSLAKDRKEKIMNNNPIIKEEKLDERGLCETCFDGYKAKVWVKPKFTELTVTGHGYYTTLLKCKQGFNISGNTDTEIVVECECYRKGE